MFADFLRAFLTLSLEISPLLIIGLLVAAALHVALGEATVIRHLGSNSGSAVIKATLLAIPLPLCSCSVVPVVASLRRKGASTGASVSFLTAAPQIGADSYALTYGLLGPWFALYRILAALVTALLGGLAENTLSGKGIKPESPPGDNREEHALDRLRGVPRFLLELFGGLADSLMIGLLLAAAILVLVPDGLCEGLFSHAPWLELLAMLAAGIPMYVCATASTPIAAAMIMKGVSPGAALVFLLSGPATNMVTLNMMRSSLGRRPTAIYLSSIALVALAAGALVNGPLAQSVKQTTETMHHLHRQGGAWWHWLGFILVGGLMLLHYLATLRGRFSIRPKEAGVSEFSMTIAGMTCPHCLGRVQDALKKSGLIGEFELELSSGILRVWEMPADPAATRAALTDLVRKAGYDVVE